jgi:hypothetical protein
MRGLDPFSTSSLPDLIPCRPHLVFAGLDPAYPFLTVVMRGLDPRIHLLRKTPILRRKMDTRVKPAYDERTHPRMTAARKRRRLQRLFPDCPHGVVCRA